MLPIPLQLTAVHEPAPEGGFTSSFEEFPDVFSQGETLEEAEKNLFEVLQMVLAYHRDEARRQEHTTEAVRREFQLAPA
jgi:predicted RNase H-like HicB family nuclease